MIKYVGDMKRPLYPDEKSDQKRSGPIQIRNPADRTGNHSMMRMVKKESEKIVYCSFVSRNLETATSGDEH